MRMKSFILFALVLFLFSCKGDKSITSEQLENTEERKVSLAEWSFHKEIFDGKMSHLDFIKKAGSMGFDGVEYVNQFFKDKVYDNGYLDSMTMIAKGAGVAQLLIMIDGEGYLADTNIVKRDSAVENHKKWVDAAAYLGCHSIRVNAHGEGNEDQVGMAAVDGLSKLATYAAKKGVNVIVENHGGYSSNGAWLARVMKSIGMENCGTLPDFGNFCLEREGGVMWGAPCLKEYDKYQGVEELMPYAKGVSAKAYNFTADGNEKDIDFEKMISIVSKSGYQGYIGVEYEGEAMKEEDGVIATKKLIEMYWK